MRAKPCISNQLSGAAAAGGLRNTLGEPLCSTMLSPKGQLFLFYMSIYGTWFEKREFGEGDYCLCCSEKKKKKRGMNFFFPFLENKEDKENNEQA